jgi:hypothetical protein
MFKIILVGLAIALRSRRKLALKNVAVHHQLETNSGPNFLHQTTSDPISPTPSAGRRGMAWGLDLDHLTIDSLSQTAVR